MVMRHLVQLLAHGSDKMQQTLATSHASLDDSVLSTAFDTARRHLSPAKIYDEYSPYFTARANEKLKERDPAYAKREALRGYVDLEFQQRRRDLRSQSVGDSAATWDPRWLDLAVSRKWLDVASVFVRPGHAALKSYLSQVFAGESGKFKSFSDWNRLLATMIAAEHPDATKAVVAALSSLYSKNVKYYWEVYAVKELVASLPKSAIQALEELTPSLDEKVVDDIVEAVDELRQRP